MSQVMEEEIKRWTARRKSALVQSVEAASSGGAGDRPHEARQWHGPLLAERGDRR